MNIRMALVSSWLAVGLAATGWLTCPAVAEDFRVHSKVYGDEEEPLAETVTLFRAGRVYDFLSEPAETTVFDPSRDLFVLLDPKTRLKCEVTTGRIAQYAARLKAEASVHGEPLLKFLADPHFEESAENPGQVSLHSGWVTYVVKTEQAASPEAAARYAEFADWSAQLNCLTSPASLPPFARLALNDVLRRRQALPLDLRLNISRREGGKTQWSRRSEHTVQWSLSRADLRRIDDAGNQLATFDAASFEEYLARTRSGG